MEPVTPAQYSASYPVALPFASRARWDRVAAEMARAAGAQVDTARLERAVDLLLAGAVRADRARAFRYYVLSAQRHAVYVIHDAPLHATCTCLDYQRRLRWCKHILAVKLWRRGIIDEGRRLVDELNAQLLACRLTPETAAQRMAAYYDTFLPPDPEPDPESDPPAAAAPPPAPVPPVRPEAGWRLTPAGAAYLDGYDRARAGRDPARALRRADLVLAHLAGYRAGQVAA